MNHRVLALVAGAASLCVGIGVGVAIGYFSAPGGDSNPEARQADQSMGDRIIAEINNENIRDNLRFYARHPHMAGTPADREGAEDIRQAWLDQGLDSAKLVPYKVWLQHPPPPDTEQSNKAQIIDPANGNRAVFESAPMEDPFGEEELLQDGFPAPFNAYSAIGDVTGDLVYVNYGRLEDYEYIVNELDPAFNFSGKVAISRHGGTGWYEKATQAYNHGISALLLYTDPLDYSVPQDVGLPYPDGKFLASTSTQRGSVKNHKGDALTPGYPAKDFAYRRPVSEANLPLIPIHPVSFGDAATLLRSLAGPVPKDEWKGRLGDDVTYAVGPGFEAPYQGMKVRVVINSESDLFTTYNVVGFIRGEIEPDRYVIIGNHRDAWGLGSIDPTSGTAAVMEISRVFGQLKKEGWRPRRTVIFCSFGAEEFGLIGSIEWTEEFGQILSDRAVGYLNLDMATVDNFVLRASATPHLRPLWYEAAKKVPDPDPSETRKTVFDTQVERSPADDDPNMPKILRIGTGSDYYGFEKRLGVPSVMGYYFYDRETYPMNFYSTYHSSYETVRLIETFIDPEYKFHQAIARAFAEMTRSLADSLVLPFDVRGYASDLTGMWRSLRNSSQARDIEAHGISLEHLETAISEFSTVSDEFQSRVGEIDTSSVVDARRMNDQMVLLDKAFLGDLPGDRLKEHILFSSRETYSRSTDDIPSGTFPGILDALHEIDQDPDQEARWRVVGEQVAILTHAVQAGITVLTDVTSW